jgi:hypothetical protein
VLRACGAVIVRADRCLASTQEGHVFKALNAGSSAGITGWKVHDLAIAACRAIAAARGITRGRQWGVPAGGKADDPYNLKEASHEGFFRRESSLQQ